MPELSTKARPPGREAAPGPGAGDGEPPAPPSSPWSRPAREVADALQTSPETGLPEEEARRRLQRHGPNRLRRHERRGAAEIMAAQFRSVIVALLVAAALLSFVFGNLVEASAIVAVLVLNALIGFFTELRAVQSMEGLRELGEVPAVVLREGRRKEIGARGLVPGDVVLVEGGDVVTADLRLLEASRLQADEAALTGESVPVDKSEAAVGREAPLAERASMLYKGTSVSRGSGAGVVVSTGMDTELGHVSALVEEAEDEVTPLERRLAALGRRLVWVTLALAALVAGSGLLSGRDPLLIVETAIALAVAAIPEGLPIVATLALARGMWRMARRNALVERLSAVETLGSTTVVLTDKTGTLTESRMRVTRIAMEGGDVEVAPRGDGAAFSADGVAVDPAGDPRLGELLRAVVLCNSSSLGDEADGEPPSGDPTETALLAAGRAAGLERGELLERWPEVEREAFDPSTKMMATCHRADGGVLVAVKGAPEAVVEASTRVRREAGEEELTEEGRRRWLEKGRSLADDGLRVLAVARRRTPDVPSDPFEDLTLLGMTGLLDPPRRDVRASVEACRSAGIRVVMITGDHPATARNVAAAVGIASDDVEVVEGRELEGSPDPGARRRLLDADVFARTSPEQKLRLLDLHQQEGDVAAMIGDGVNDAPALKKADIGVAMGRRGTQVAREAADMVLQDDRFATVVAAVEQGRAIFDNIRKFVVYLLSCNVSEIMVVTLATLAGAPLPILPLQILFLNLVTDVFPALALGGLEGAEGLMRRPPRDPDEPVLTRGHWWAVAGHGAALTAAVLTGLALALGRLEMEPGQAVTVSFLVLAFGQLWHVFNMSGPESGVLRNEVTGSWIVWGAVLLCVGLLLAGVYLPFVARILGVETPGAAGWAVVAGLSLAPLAAGRAVAAGRRLLA